MKKALIKDIGPVAVQCIIQSPRELTYYLRPRVSNNVEYINIMQW